MAKKKVFELNRKEYDKIKKMDHSTMESHMAAVYSKGLDAGVKIGQNAAGSFDMSKCLEAILNIKGIGPTKIEQIRLAMIASGAKE